MLVFFVGNTFLAESEEDWGGFPLTLEVVTSSRSVRVSADVALAAYVREQMLMCLSTMTGDITSTTGKPYPVVRADFMSGDDYDFHREHRGLQVTLLLLLLLLLLLAGHDSIFTDSSISSGLNSF
jgi:hypothetical protein